MAEVSEKGGDKLDNENGLMHGQGMKELIHVNFDEESLTVSARELHEKLQIKTRFTMWFERMLEFGFDEMDYKKCFPNLGSGFNGGQNTIDYQISVDMAKQICLVQKNAIGMMYRKYFLDLEKAWNTPEQVMARALQMSKQTTERLEMQCRLLGQQIMKQQQMIEEMKPKVNYTDMVLRSSSLMLISQICNDYGMSAQKLNKLLHKLGIQYKVRGQWVLYADYHGKGYVQSTTYVQERSNGNVLTREQTEWTQKGRLFIYQVLKSQGILPCVERG